MTRETKVGAVVAISFLSLVGVVVVSKWRNQGAGPELTQNAPQQSEQNAKPQPPDPKPEQPAPKPANQGGIENAKFEQPVLIGNLPNKLPGGEESNNNALPALPMLDPKGLPPLPVMSEDEKRRQLAEQIAKQNSALPALPALPPLPVPNQSVSNQPGPIDKTLDNAAAQLDQAKKKTADAVSQGANTLGNGLDDFFTRANDKLNKDAAKVENQASDRINQGLGQLDKNAADLLKQGSAELNKGVDKVNSALPPLPPPPVAVNNGNNGNNTLPPLPAPANANPLLPMPAPISDKDKLPGLPQPALNSGLPAPAPAPVSTNSAPLPPVTNADVPRPMIPAPPNNPPLNNPPVNTPPVNNPPVNNPLLGNLPAPPVIDAKTTVPPIPAPNSPQVRDVETINYTIKGGETLEAISKARYGSEKYAKAILAYNRDLAPMGKLLTATLQPGQSVLLPSADFLEDRYAAAITAGPVAPISINAPVPAVPPIPMPGANTAAAGKTYRVPAQGQFLFEIAIRTLGEGNRWSEIYRLNPNINPQQPIPGGTELRLPANAKLP
jgi:nucleoid-associated protein YgaU